VSLWVNGTIVDDEALVIRADDHGVVVGDGVFETCEVRDGQPFALSRHLRRLRESVAGLFLGYDEDVIRAGIAAVLDDGVDGGVEGRIDRGRLRVTVTGGPSPYGSDRGDAAPTILIATGPLKPWPATDDVAVVPWTRNERAATAGLKTTSYADNVVALRWAHDRGAAEAIFANTRGDVCEGTGSNVFYEHDGALVTPPLSSGCLAGITRELLLEWLRAEGVVVHEQAQPSQRLRSAREAFLTSSTRRVQAIGAIDATPCAEAPGPLTKQAAEIFDRYAAQDMDP
jgi:branched-chain amino acid aminotransferase